LVIRKPINRQTEDLRQVQLWRRLSKLTTDGCHMNKLGNIMMAKGVLRAFGMSEAKIALPGKRWLQ